MLDVPLSITEPVLGGSVMRQLQGKEKINYEKIYNFLFFLTTLFLNSTISFSAEKAAEPMSPGWSFKGFFGTFDRASLQRGYQVYTEVCASCHSMKHLSYRNLSQPGGPEFSEEQVKIIASQFEVRDGPNDDGEMFDRPARPSDNFVSPYANDKEATAANGGAYPPDMSVLVKARKGGADYIYSLLLGYEEPPEGISLDDGVYYNKYMAGNKIKMSNPLSEGIVEYADGTNAYRRTDGTRCYNISFMGCRTTFRGTT